MNKDFITGEFPTYTLKPTQKDVGTFAVYITLKDKYEMYPKNETYNFTIKIYSAPVHDDQKAKNNSIEDQEGMQKPIISSSLLANISKIDDMGQIFITFSEIIFIPSNYESFNES